MFDWGGTEIASPPLFSLQGASGLAVVRFLEPHHGRKLPSAENVASARTGRSLILITKFAEDFHDKIIG